MADEQDLELLQERIKRQRMAELLTEQSESPNRDIALNLAGGFAQAMKNSSNGQMNAARLAVGQDPINYAAATNPMTQVMALERQKQMDRRKQALGDVELLDQFDRRKDAKAAAAKEESKADLQRKQTLAMAGYELGVDGMPSAVKGGKAEWDIKNAQADYEKKLADARKSSAKAGGGVDGVDRNFVVPGVGEALTKTDATELKAAAVSKSKMDRQLQEMIDLRKQYGGEVMNRAAVARGQQLSKDILLTYKNLQKLGVLSQSDESIINAIIPSDPLQFTSGVGKDPILSNLEKFKADNEQDYNTNVSMRVKNPAPSEDEQAVNWARANSNNPDAKEILKLHGLL